MFLKKLMGKTNKNNGVPEDLSDKSNTNYVDVIEFSLIGLSSMSSGQGDKINNNNYDVNSFSEIQQRILKYPIFGKGVFSVPCELIGKCNDPDYQYGIPFRFFNVSDETNDIENFRLNYGDEIYSRYSLLGFLLDEMVLLNNDKETIHFIHPADIADESHFRYRIEEKICMLEEFLEFITPQSVCCFMDPESSMHFNLFEKKGKTLIYELNPLTSEGVWEKKEYETEELCIKAYNELVELSKSKGYSIHYGPRGVE